MPRITHYLMMSWVTLVTLVTIVTIVTYICLLTENLSENKKDKG